MFVVRARCSAQSAHDLLFGRVSFKRDVCMTSTLFVMDVSCQGTSQCWNVVFLKIGLAKNKTTNTYMFYLELGPRHWRRDIIAVNTITIISHTTSRQGGWGHSDSTMSMTSTSTRTSGRNSGAMMIILILAIIAGWW